MKSRAAILRDVGGPWRIETFDLDAPRTGEVLIRMAAAGLYHSDTHILNGYVSDPGRPARKRPPTIGGHEGSAVVVEVGPGVTGLAPGDHVVTSFVPACGRCRCIGAGIAQLRRQALCSRRSRATEVLDYGRAGRPREGYCRAQ